MSDRGRQIEVVTEGVIPSLPNIEPPTLTLPHEGGGNWTTLTLPHEGGGNWTTLTLPHEGGGNWTSLTLPHNSGRNWAEANGEFVESLNRAVGGLEQLGRKRQRAPVMRPSHQRIADGARLIALSQEVT